MPSIVKDNQTRRRERLEVVKRLYVKEKWGVRPIARYLGAPMSQVRYDLRHLGIATPRQLPDDAVSARVLELRMQARRMDTIRRQLPDTMTPPAQAALRRLLRLIWPDLAP